MRTIDVVLNDTGEAGAQEHSGMCAEARIPGEVADVLRYYVYPLRDPRDGRVFYVGKGIGDRINAHVREAGADLASERAKIRAINEIAASGQPVDLLFLRTGIEDEHTAFIVEQAVIDAIHADHHSLTNLVRGHHSGQHGLATLPAVVAGHQAEPSPPIPEPVIMLKIQNGWRPDMNDREIYDATRGHWKITGLVRDRTAYALGIAYGIVRGVYRVDSWFPSEMPGGGRCSASTSATPSRSRFGPRSSAPSRPGGSAG